MVSRNIVSESDLPTSPAEDRTRTFDTVTPDLPASDIPGPATGDILKERFVLHERLPGGAGSRVFRALDRRREAAGDDNPWVVLKIVTSSPGETPRTLQSLRREAAISQGLEHPNLPWIRGLDQDGPHTFLCLAWLPGASLASLLDQRGSRPLPVAQALDIATGIGRALGYLHGLGITHADVKPANILVSPEGHPTLLDLGVALGPEAIERSSAHGFTPQYASPGVRNGEKPTPADDLYSLACVAYRMLAGRRAFGEGDAQAAAASGPKPERPDDMPEARWRALEQALAFARADRQHSVEEFLAQLNGLPAGPPPGTDRVPGPQAIVTPPPATRQRRPWPWRPAAAVAAVTVAFVAALFTLTPILRDRKPPAPTALAPAAPEPAPRPERLEPPAKKRPAATERRSVAEPAARKTLRPLVEPAAPVPVPAQPTAVALPQPDIAPVNAPMDAPVSIAAPADAAPASGAPATVAAAAAAAPAPAASPDNTAGNTVDEQRVPFSSLKLRQYVKPGYPRIALARRAAGWAEVAFTVDAAGKTRDVRIVGAEPPGLFEDAAVRAVRRWRFEPASGEAPDALVSSVIRLRFDPR